jgi:hypothetical protein
METGFDLKNLADTSNNLLKIDKQRLECGDQVYLKTLNSIYIIKVLEESEYLVSGGWFDTHKLSPHKINIRGCTWGGTAILTDIIAAPGLCIEFSNNLITSRIQKVYYFSRKSIN